MLNNMTGSPGRQKKSENAYKNFVESITTPSLRRSETDQFLVHMHFNNLRIVYTFLSYPSLEYRICNSDAP